jgi:hypothetical protein
MSQNIFKQKLTRDFTTIPNEILRNPELTWKAKAIHSYLLSLPETWVVHLNHLKKVSKDGYDSTVSGINELLEKKYLWRRPRSGDNPGGWEYYVYQQPQLEDPFRLGDSPTRDFPESEKSTTSKDILNKVNKDLINKDSENLTDKDQTESYLSTLPPDRQNKPTEQPEDKAMSATAEQKTPPHSAPPSPQYSADFETFWTAYPRKIGKQAAYREWKRCKVDLPTALKAIEQQRKAGMFKEQQYIIYPERWIKNGRWEEIETAPQLRVNAPVASSNPQAGSSCHRIKSEGLEDAFWNWFQTQREWEERRNLRTVDDVWLDQFLLSLSEEF